MPLAHRDTIVMSHGSGGRMTLDLIRSVFQKYFDNPLLARGNDFADIQEDDLEKFKNSGLKIRVWMPERKLTDDSLNFSPNSIRYMYEQGLAIAERGPTLIWNYEETAG